MKCDYTRCANEALHRCAACVSAAYCSQECQRLDWTYHQHRCSVLKERTCTNCHKHASETQEPLQVCPTCDDDGCFYCSDACEMEDFVAHHNNNPIDSPINLRHLIQHYLTKDRRCTPKQKTFWTLIQSIAYKIQTKEDARTEQILKDLDAIQCTHLHFKNDFTSLGKFAAERAINFICPLMSESEISALTESFHAAFPSSSARRG